MTKGSLGLDRRGLTFSDQRTYLDSQLVYINKQNIRLAGKINYESDSEINRDFRIENFTNSQWNDYYLELDTRNTGVVFWLATMAG